MQTILQKGMLILYKQERNFGNLILPYNCNIKKILITGFLISPTLWTLMMNQPSISKENKKLKYKLSRGENPHRTKAKSHPILGSSTTVVHFLEAERHINFPVI